MKTNTLAFLESKHKDLLNLIEVLESEKAPDKYIKPLEKEKLALKDEMERLRSA